MRSLNVFSLCSAFFKWLIPVIHLGPWEFFITELCSGSHQNLSRFHVFVGYKFNNALRYSRRKHLLTHRDHCWQKTGNVILFCTRISVLEKKVSPVYIWTDDVFLFFYLRRNLKVTFVPSRDNPGCHTLWCCGRVPTFQKSKVKAAWTSET